MNVLAISNVGWLRGRVQAFYFGKNNFELGVGGEGQDTSRHFGSRFGSIRAKLPNKCPCKASEQKLEQKPKSGLKVKTLYIYCHHSICLLKTSKLKKIKSKLDVKWPSYANLMFLPKRGIWPFCANWWPFWPNVFRFGLHICFAQYLH